MSEPTESAQPRYALYRCNVNLNGLGAGTWIEIDPDDPAWWGPIEDGHIVSDGDWLGVRGPDYPGAVMSEELRQFVPLAAVDDPDDENPLNEDLSE